jgi:glycosyltransferase involved in cell wall biosynthesis
VLVDRPRDLRLAALAALARPVAIVNRYNLSRRRPPPDLLSRLAYARVRLTVFVSEASARQALAGAGYLRRKPYRVIPGGVDTGHFRPDPAAAERFRAAYGLAGPPYLLAVGSLTGDKRYDFLLEVVARLGADAPVFVVCGDGPLRASLEEQARRLGVAARFLGLVPHDLLPGAYGAASCLMHGCAVETFGLSVLEAMACGTPVFAVRGGAVPEVLDGAGLLAPPEDREAAAGHVRALLAGPERRRALGSLGRARAVEHFSVEAMRRSYADAIESLVP